MKIEEWKAIPGIETFEVSSKGRVRRSLNAPKAINTFPGRELIPDDSSPYLRVSLRSGGKLYRECVHRLVARAFLGSAPKFAHVNHKDGNKRNNAVENLEWCSPQENVKHAWKSGLCQPVVGEHHGLSKLTDRDIEVILSAKLRGVSQREIAKVFNVSETNISSICLGKTRVKNAKS